MSDELKPVYQDDEIDLFELIETLWKEKVWIVLFVFVSLTGSGGYAMIAKELYNVQTSLSFQTNAIDQEELRSRVTNAMRPGWVKDNKSDSFTITTLTPEAVDAYSAELTEIARSITLAVKRAAIDEIEVIESELTPQLQGTEYVASRILNAKRLLRELADENSTVISFSQPMISLSAPKRVLIVALSIVLGGMVGVLFVLIRSAVRKRKAA